MASNHTEHYQLNQWEAGDKVLRTDFNADNAKIDGALHALAGQTEVLETEVQSRGNCKIEHFTYKGTGTYGESAKTSLTFSAKPWLIAIINCSNGAIMVAVQGQPTSWVRQTGATWNNFTWSGNMVSWYSTSGDNQMNERGTIYQVVVLLDAEE